MIHILYTDLNKVKISPIFFPFSQPNLLLRYYFLLQYLIIIGTEHLNYYTIIIITYNSKFVNIIINFRLLNLN